MIKKYAAVLVLMFICQAGYSQKSIDQLFGEFSKAKGVSEVRVGKIAMGLAALFTETMGVEDIEVLEFKSCSSAIKQQFSQAIRELKDSKYETMVNNNNDGERTKVLIRIKDDVIHELVVLTTGDGGTMVRIKGKIKSSDIENVMKQHNGSNGC